MANSINEIFHIGASILSTTVDAVTSTILAQLGSITEEYVFSDNAEMYQGLGLASRPSNPNKGKNAAECIAIKGSRDVIIACRDTRGQAIYGSLKEGETCLYASGADGTGQARILLKGDSSINIYTRSSPTGTGMVLQMVPATDTINIFNAAGFGITIDPTNGVRVTSKAASLTLDTSGNATLVGKAQTQVDGAGVVIGSLAIPGLNSALTGVTGVAGKASLKVLIE